jgi:succinylglutamate desuccinylase
LGSTPYIILEAVVDKRDYEFKGEIMKKTCNYKKLPIGTYLKTSVGNKKDIIELVSKNPFIFRSLASTEKTNLCFMARRLSAGSVESRTCNQNRSGFI